MLTIRRKKTIAVRDGRWRGMSRCVSTSVSVTRSHCPTSTWSTTDTRTANAGTTSARSTTPASPYNGRTDHKASEKNNTKRLWHIDLRAMQLSAKETDHLNIDHDTQSKVLLEKSH